MSKQDTLTTETPENEDVGTQPEVSKDIQDLISKTTNAAHSAHSTRMMKAIDKRLNSLSDSFAERLAAIAETKTPTAPVKQKDEYIARLKELEGRLEEEKSRREAEASKARSVEERGALSEALRSAGVQEERLRGALALLYTEDKRIKRNDAGQVSFAVQKSGYEDLVSVEDGVKGWLDSDEGRHYLPARPVSGSGAQGDGRAPVPVKGGDPKRNAMINLQRVLAGEQPI